VPVQPDPAELLRSQIRPLHEPLQIGLAVQTVPAFGEIGSAPVNPGGITYETRLGVVLLRQLPQHFQISSGTRKRRQLLSNQDRRFGITLTEPFGR
jgi:hypothetical protein